MTQSYNCWPAPQPQQCQIGACICNLHHSSRQCQILHPPSEVGDRTCTLMVPRPIRFHCATMGTPVSAGFNLSSYKHDSPPHTHTQDPDQVVSILQLSYKYLLVKKKKKQSLGLPAQFCLMLMHPLFLWRLPLGSGRWGPPAPAPSLHSGGSARGAQRSLLSVFQQH